MSRKLFIAGNWKLNHLAGVAAETVQGLREELAGVDTVDIAVCPTFTSLSAAVTAAAGSNIGIGAQNVAYAENGAYTGEISAAMLKEIPVTYVIIGHSERRQYFNETDETVNQRLKQALAADLAPIVCVGEMLEDREGGNTEAVVGTQLAGSLAGLSAEEMASVTIAYEPVWAIGTGKTATPEMAQETHAFIRGKLAELFGQATADVVRIQYGGSVKPANAAELMAQPDIDGALVGGASLKVDVFSELIKTVA
jgi:triosephosphate isomerase